MSTLAKLMVELGLDNNKFMKGVGESNHLLRNFGLGVLAVGVAAGAGLLKIGSDWDAATDTIITKTGASGKALTDLENTTKDVFKSIPTDMQTAANAVSELSVRTGATGKDLDELAKSEIELARITKTDLTSNIEASTKVFNSFGVGVKDQTSTLDSFFRISQKTGIGVDVLMQEVEQFNPQLKAMGLNATQGANLIGKIDQAGGHASVIFRGMTKATNELNKAGIPLKKGMTDYYNSIKNAGSAAEASAIAVKIFGSKAGPELAQMILDGTLSVDDLTGAVDENGDSILATAAKTNDLAENFKIFKNNLEAALIPLGTLVFQGLNLLVPLLTIGVDAISKFASALGQAYDTGRQTSTIVSAFPGILQPVVLLFLEVADAIGDVVRAWDKGGLRGMLDAIPGAISQVLGALGNLASTTVNLVLDGVVSFAGDFPDMVGNAAGWLIDKIFGSPRGSRGKGHSGGGAFSFMQAMAMTLDGAISLAGDIYDMSLNAAGWLYGKVTAVNWNGKLSLGAVTLDATFSLASDIDWSFVSADLAIGMATAVRDATYAFSPLDMFNFTTTLGTALGPALVTAVSSAFDAFKADPVGASKVALEIAGAVILVFASPLILAALLTAALSIWVGAAIVGLANGILQGATGVDFSTVGLAIYAKIKEGIDAIVDWATMLYSKGVDLITGLNDGLAAAWYLITDSITGAIAWILTEFATAQTWLNGPGQLVITGLNDGLAAAWGLVVGSIQGAIGWIITQFGTAGTWLYSAGVNVITGLHNGLAAAWHLVDDDIQGTKNGIINWFADADGWLYNAGAAVVQGLADGIASMRDVAVSTMQGIIDTIKNLPLVGWVLHSPSKLFHGYGVMLMQGLANGIDASANRAAGSMSSAIDRVSGAPGMSMSFGAMGSAYGASGTGGMSGPSVYGGIHISVSGAGDPDAVADRVFAKFSRSLQLQGAA